MEYSINTQSLSTLTTIFKENAEQSIDLDFNLPDYCPDIQKILKCQAYPKITSKNLTENKLDIEGIVIINLIYLDSEKLITHSCEHTNPFTVSYKLKNPIKENNNIAIFSKPDVEYINCRAITQRRLDIHGAFFVNTEIKQKTENNIPTSVENETIEQKLEAISVNNLETITQKEFTITETFELEKDLLPIENIINSNLSVKLKDYRAITNKLIINCIATINMLYINNIETGEINSLSQTYEFSQIVDIENLTEEDTLSITVEPLVHDINLKSDSTGEAALLALESKFIANIYSFKTKNIDALVDAYSTLYKTDITTKETILDTFSRQITTEYTHEPKINLNNLNISRIIDLRNELSSVKTQYDGTNIKFTGKYNICALYINLENEISYIEKIIDFEYLYNLNETSINKNALTLEPNVNITSIEYNFTENKTLELTVSIIFTCNIYETKKIKLIENIIVAEETPIKKENKFALTLYYAEPNEKIWNIAKKYLVSAYSIKEENDISEDEISTKTMLLIPN